MPSVKGKRAGYNQALDVSILIVVTPEERRRAQLQVCSHAQNEEDAEFLLGILGLI